MASEETKVLVFCIGNEYYATDIMEVERILGYENPTKIPDAPRFIDGVINYEGNILPVISLSKRFNIGSEDISKDAKIIIAKDENTKLGIVVDHVSEVKDVKMSQVECPPDYIAGISKRYLKGLIKTDEKIIVFLNLSAILTDEEKNLI